ncbi:DHA2 family efflux MFS transporter permease subunit [Leifsonia poae]|uniref:MFS transporter n=1 Tax=Leifsonia poae TaxID=110933 RepID=A0A9W6H968_9MICO|nr:DHA2 family efflux MFS transporter permease subunit [Leifsonia poae]GLJ75881.1 MFS transporter [Leifsonia poae]
MTTTALAPTGSTRSTHRWWALTVLALAEFLVVLDASIVNIALPALGTQLHLDTAALAWVITAYVLPFGGLLLLGGRLADRVGHRRVFLIGVAGFVAASALAGLSATGGMLLAARAVQGASAALLAPASLALLTQLFTSAGDRAKALGVWGAVAGIGSAAGVLLGGVLTAALGWQAVFFVNVPVGIVVLAVIPALVGRDPRAEAQRMDVAGAVTITLGLTATVAALSSAGQLGWASPLTLGMAAAALALLAAFVIVERRAEHPLVPFRFFLNRDAATGNLVMLLAGGATTALFFALSVYLQEVLGYDALTAGVSQLPLAGALVLVAGVVPTVVSRLGLRSTVTGALVVFAGGILWLAAAGPAATFVGGLLGPSILIGAGLGAVFMTATQLAVDGTEAADSGLASGLVNTSQQVGGALGLAILGSIAAARAAGVSAAGGSTAVALSSGFSWLFIGAAALAVIGAGVAVVLRRR